jgi:hypothetical protein
MITANKMSNEKHIITKQQTLKTQSGDIITKVNPEDILIVDFNDGFFDIQTPIYASNMQDYHKPVALLKRNPSGLYERFEVK